MKKLHLYLLFLGVTLVSGQSQAQNYELKVSSLIQSCDFIHRDEYSFKPVLNLIQEQLKTKLDGDKDCTAPLAQLSNQLSELDNYYAKDLSQKDKKQLTLDAQKQYLIDLNSELALLDPSIPTDAARIQMLASLMNTVKTGIVTLGVDVQIAGYEDEKNKQSTLNSYWEGVYSRSSNAIAAMNSLPDKCVNKLGGWKTMVPAVLNLASIAGPIVGGAYGSIVSAGFQVGSQLVILLQNNRVKRAISETTKIQNQQIIACSYLALQTNACELKRAKKLMDHKKIYDVINRQFKDPRYEEYERYFRVVETLPKVQRIFNDIGSMGSALTLDLDLLIRYFNAVKLQPESIITPPDGAPESVLSDFIIKMRSRGLSTAQLNSSGTPISIADQVNNLKVLIDQAMKLIESVRGILISKRSFVDLKEEIITNNQFATGELKFFRRFIQSYLNSENLPAQYRSIFKINEGMLNVLIDFVSAEMTQEESVEEYRNRINILGQKLFDEMSMGSVAQITTQSVLMIPSIAFERFNRPIKALEHWYVSNDIALKDDPAHVSYTDFVINQSLQIKLISLYEPLNGSSQAFRVETYLAALKGIEKGFKRDIIRMIKKSMESKSDVLVDFEGVTAAQLCALFAPFLKDESPDTLKSCQEKYKELDLFPILKEVNRPVKMTIDYNDSCFYNNYKREERGQRRLFEKLIDYGSRNNLIWDQ